MAGFGPERGSGTAYWLRVGCTSKSEFVAGCWSAESGWLRSTAHADERSIRKDGHTTFRFDLVADTTKDALSSLIAARTGSAGTCWSSSPQRRSTLWESRRLGFRVVAHGNQADVAPALLARVEKLVGTGLTVEPLNLQRRSCR